MRRLAIVIAVACAVFVVLPRMFSRALRRTTAQVEAPVPRAEASSVAPARLAWPIDCVLGQSCKITNFPDLAGNGSNSFCTRNSITGHEGTDIVVTKEQAARGVAVFAAAAGKVLWVFDGKYDDCPSSAHSDCSAPTSGMRPDQNEGYRVCTPSGPFCDRGENPGERCFWCFDGGNVVVLRHEGLQGVFATRYDHFKRGSIAVHPGDGVAKGQKLGEVGSAGHSTEPHLHFEVWGDGFYKLVDPWKGPCSVEGHESLWENQPAVL